MTWLKPTILVIFSMLMPISARAAESRALESSIDTLAVQKIARGGDFLGFGFGAVWMMSGMRLSRVDTTDNKVTDIAVPGNSGGSFRGVGIGEGAIWIPDCANDKIFKVDPNTNKIVLTIPAEMVGSEGSIGVGEGAIWVVTDEESGERSLTRFNSKSGSAETKIPLSGGGAGVVVEYGYVWLTDELRDKLYQIDPKTNAIASTISLRSMPRFVASGEGSIWVLNQGDGTVQRVDGQTGEVTATIETGRPGGGGDIATGGGYVWVTMPRMPVAQIDPRTNSLVRKFTGGGMGDAIRFGAGSLWVSGSFIHRIQPPE